MALQTKSISANGSKGHHKFTLNINEDSTSLANNSSTISWSFVLSPLATGWDWYYSNSKPVEYTVTINGTATTGVIYDYNGSATLTVKTGSVTIPHNADGTKSISFSFSVTSLNQSFLPGSASASGTMALTSIPRAATLLTAPNFSDGQNPTITYSNPAGSAVESLKACILLTDGSSVPYREISKTGSSYTFALTSAEKTTLQSGVKSGTSTTVKFQLATVIGGVTYYSTLSRTFSLTNAAMPTLDPEVVDIDDKTIALTNDSSTFIRYCSAAYFNVNATASQGATISSLSVRNGSQIIENSSGIIYGVENEVFEFTATDSRGNKISKNVEVNLIPYVKLNCLLKVYPANTSGNAEYSISGQYYNGSLGSTDNTLDVYVYYRKAGDTTWDSFIVFDVDITGNSYSASGYLNGLDYTATYECYAFVYDKLMTVQTHTSTITGKPTFDWGKDDFNFNVDVSLDYGKKIQGTLYDGSKVDVIEFNDDYGDLRIGYGQLQAEKETKLCGDTVNIVTTNGFFVDGEQVGGSATITESGTSGIWSYRKWSDGTAECWGNKTFTIDFSTTTWGGMYTSGAISGSNITFPTSLFVDTPNIQASLLTRSTGGILMAPGGTGTNVASKTQTGVYEICRGTSLSGVGFTICYNAKGRWKN